MIYNTKKYKIINQNKNCEIRSEDSNRDDSKEGDPRIPFLKNVLLRTTCKQSSSKARRGKRFRAAEIVELSRDGEEEQWWPGADGKEQ
jgi:hypothetical protein